eukprot:SAG22_NODE_2909_length_2110_cov_3.407757_4_plen_47_part_01
MRGASVGNKTARAEWINTKRKAAAQEAAPPLEKMREYKLEEARHVRG